ncbi:MAG TPA: zinc-binding dehydrogenase [Casimicrobiaceae bacterium]|nr:zinc-binding dehydrogenase [Casimicrobiaceae bacterium]
MIDTVGGPSQEPLFALAKPGGIIVSSVSQPSAELARQRGVRAVLFVVDVNAADLARLLDLFDTRELITSVGTVLPPAEARTAHKTLDGKGPADAGGSVCRLLLDEVNA